MAVARTERPGLVALRPADRRADRPGPVRRRPPRPDRPAGRAEPPRLDLRGPRQHRGRRPTCATARATRSSPSSCWRSIALAVGVGGIWLLFIGVSALVEPAAAEVARPDPAVGLRRPGPAAAGVFLVYPAAGTIMRSFQDDDGAVHARELRGAGRRPTSSTILRNNVLWLVVGTAAACGLGLAHRRALRPRPARGAGQDLRLPAAGHLARRRVGHLALRLRLAARRPAAVRPAERDLDGLRRRADPVVQTQPDQHLPARS